MNKNRRTGTGGGASSMMERPLAEVTLNSQKPTHRPAQNHRADSIIGSILEREYPLK